MSAVAEDNAPKAADYLALFDRYREAMGAMDPGRVYLAPEDERFKLLFHQVCHLLAQSSPFNRAMPPEFRLTAQRYLRKEPATMRQMGEPQVRHFMLSDLYDYMQLCERIGQPLR